MRNKLSDARTVAWPRRRLIRILAISVAAFVLIALAGLTALLNLTFSFNDGPFRGSTAECPSAQPVQVLPIGGDSSLAVFAPTSAEESPVVSLIRSGEPSWCIRADGYPETRVFDIRFRSVRFWPFFRRHVVGTVHWTYGHEATWWFIDRNGDLEEYWYSW